MLSKIAYYGGALILLPFMGGGFIGWILLLSKMSKNIAYGIGFSIALMFGIYLLIRQSREDRATFSQQKIQNDKDIASGIVEIIEFDVQKVWEIDGLEDSGPGYLFQADENQFDLPCSCCFSRWRSKVLVGTHYFISKLFGFFCKTIKFFTKNY